MFLITECTLAGALELASSRTTPFLWDDASDFSVIEKLAVVAFNQVNKTCCLHFDNVRDKCIQLITQDPWKVKRTNKLIRIHKWYEYLK